ncbi:hypothetical protein ACQUWS_25605, partial [Ralstonia pseudosolanacearum]
MFPRRWFFLVWLAIVLNVLSPVLASARAAQSGTLAVDLCSATAPHGSTVRISIDLRDEGGCCCRRGWPSRSGAGNEATVSALC